MTQFQKGQSGNPNGRPKGSNNHHALRKILMERAPDLLNKAIDDALNGDKAMMKLCLDRVLPALKSQELNITNCDLHSDFPLIDLSKKLSDTLNQKPLTILEAQELLIYARLREQLLEVEKKDTKLISDRKWEKENRIDF